MRDHMALINLATSLYTNIQRHEHCQPEKVGPPQILSRLGWKLCLFIMLYAAAGTSLGDSEVARQLAATKLEMEQIQKRIRTDERNRNDIQTEIAEFDHKLAKTTDIIAANRAKLQHQTREINKVRGQEQNLSRRMSEQTKRLTRLVQIKYHQGQSGPIKLLLNGRSPAELGRILEWYGYLNTAVNNQRQTMTAELDELARLRHTMKQAQEERHRVEIQQLNKKQSLSRLRHDRLILITRLDNELNQSSNRLAGLKKNQAHLTDLLNQITHAVSRPVTLSTDRSFVSQKGRLPSPIFAPVRYTFGQSRGDDETRWQGIMFDAREGKPIKAIHGGRVVFAEWLRGYGLLMILDHGSGYMSLYGHAQILNKKVGDAIERGDILGLVGNSGGLSQASLYFEVRHNGIAQNPVLWCRLPS